MSNNCDEVHWDPELEVEILEEINKRFGHSFEDQGEAFYWFRTQPIPGHGGKTARDLARAGLGREVLVYFQTLDRGSHA